MRYSLMVAGLLTGLLAMPAMAEMKIGVVDLLAAVNASDAAKKASTKLQSDSKVQVDRINQLENELETLKAKANKDSSVMSPKDKQDLQRQFESKMQEYQNLVQTVQRRVQEVNNELVQSMQPKLEAIVGEIQRAEKFNVILERKAAIYADPALDITKKVTERLNAGATSGGTGKPAK